MRDALGSARRWDALRTGLLDPTNGVIKPLELLVKRGLLLYDGPTAGPPDGRYADRLRSHLPSAASSSAAGRTIVVLVTDGAPNDSAPASFSLSDAKPKVCA
jgi:hypothetical protein